MNAQGALWRFATTALFALVVQTAFLGQAEAQDAGNRQNSFLLGTGSTEGTYHPVGVALSTLIKLKLLPSLNVDLTAINTDGSQENVDLVRQDGIQFAILSALSAHQARQGLDRFADFGPDENLRAITTLWRSAEHVIVRKDAVQSGTINDFVQLRGRPLSMGRPGSGTLIGNRALMAPLGVNIDTDFDLAELGFEDSADALINGDIDGMALSGGLPIRAVQRVFDALGDNAAVLEFNDEQLVHIDQGRRVWTRAVIPAETYPGLDRDIFTVSTPNILAVRGDIDDDVVYEITKTIFENLDYLQSLHQATSQISLDTAVSHLPLPVHDGALRYFEEKGVELPASPVEVDPNLLSRYDDTSQARDEANLGVLSMFTGADGDTSARVAAELASTLTVADDGFRVLPTFGGGSGQNLTDLLYMKGVDSALMRTDVVAYALENNVYPFLEDQITYIAEMFPEEVHLVARADIGSLRELAGEKVNVGAPGSGDDITASIILSQLDIPVQTTNFDSHVALEKLKSGELSAAFLVGGKPMPLLSDIDESSGLTLLPIPFVQYADNYRSASITPGDYPNLLAQTPDASISTLAVRTGLFTYSWRSDSQRYNTLARFSNVFFDHLSELQQEGRHPKWRQVDPTSEIAGLRRFEPARLWIDSNADIAQRIAQEGRQLIEDSSLLLPINNNVDDIGDGYAPVSAPILLNSRDSTPAGLETERSTEAAGEGRAYPTLEGIRDSAFPSLADDPSSLSTNGQPTDAATTAEQPLNSSLTGPSNNSRPPSSGGQTESLPAATVNAPTF